MGKPIDPDDLPTAAMRSPNSWHEGSSTSPFARRPQPTRPVALSMSIGRVDDFPQVPGYRIDGRLGRGGMGVVYRAVQLSVNRPVALKMLSGAQTDLESRARFRKEAEALASLWNPNVIAVYDVGEADGSPYFSMELIEGGTLGERIQRSPPSPMEAAVFAAQLAHGVQAAHDAGILHRDLKPSNVLLTRSPDTSHQTRTWVDGRPSHPTGSASVELLKLADFGIAKRFGAARGTDLTMTQAGDLLGTPSYMSPEQAEGGSDRVIGPTADVYSLGAILYEMLVRRPPFDEGDPVKTLMRVIDDDPTPPSRIVHGVPRDIETICMKCLHKDPRKRYSTAAELASDLERFIDGRPIKARPVTWFGRGAKWCKRRPGTAALVGSMVLLVLSSFVGITSMWRTARLAAQKQTEQREIADESGKQLKKKKLEIEIQLANGFLEKGIALCHSDDVPRGMVSIARAIELFAALRSQLADDANETARLERLDSVARSNLASWDVRIPLRVRALMSTIRAKSDSWVVDVDLSPDNRKALTASRDGYVRMYDTETNAEIGTPLRFESNVIQARFSPNGQQFLTIRFDSFKESFVLRVWNTLTRQPVSPESPIFAVRIVSNAQAASGWLPDGQLILQTSPSELAVVGPMDLRPSGPSMFCDVPVLIAKSSADGQVVYASMADGSVARFNRKDGKQTHRSDMSQQVVFSISVHESKVLTARASGEIDLWTADELKLVRSFDSAAVTDRTAGKYDGAVVHTATISADGNVIVGGGFLEGNSVRQGFFQQFDPNTGKQLARIEHPLPVWSAAVTKNGRCWVTGCEDGKVRVFHDGKPVHEHAQRGTVGKVLIGSDNQTLIAGDMGHAPNPLLGELAPMPTKMVPFSVPKAAADFAIGTDGSQFSYRLGDGSLAVTEFTTLKQSQFATGIAVNRVRVSPDSKWVAAFSHPDDKQQPMRIELYEMATGQLRWGRNGMKSECPIWLNDSSGFLLASWDETQIQCMNVDGTIRWQIQSIAKAWPHDVKAVSVGPGLIAITTRGLGRVRIVDVKNGQEVKSLKLEGTISEIAGHPSENRVLISTSDGYGQELDALTGRPTGALMPFRGNLHDCVYHRSGKYVLFNTSTDKWRHLQVFDVETGITLGPPVAGEAQWIWAGFHPIEPVIVAVDDSRRVTFHRLPQPLVGPAEQVQLWVESKTRMTIARGTNEYFRSLNDLEVGDRRKKLRTQFGGDPVIAGTKK